MYSFLKAILVLMKLLSLSQFNAPKLINYFITYSSLGDDRFFCHPVSPKNQHSALNFRTTFAFAHDLIFCCYLTSITLCWSFGCW